MNNTRMYKLTALLAFLIIACGEEPVMEQVDDREGVNILQLKFETPNEDPIIYRFEDLDGPGGNDPIIQTMPIASNTQYFTTVEVFRGDTNLTDEIKEESADHQYFYSPNGIEIELTYGDQDGNGFPLGAFVAMVGRFGSS